MNNPNFDLLVKNGLVQEKPQPNNLRLFKYRKKVFFKNLWHKDPLLLDARGIILDPDNNIVQMPFEKVFNHFENGIKVDRDRQVVAPRKINGFLAAATWHKGKLLASTTGSTTSEFVDWANHYLDRPGIRKLLQTYPTHSWLFEICCPQDPHIIEEKEGAYLIGSRGKHLGSPMVSEDALDIYAKLDFVAAEGIMRPEVWKGRFSDLMQILKTVKHEGFVVRDAENGKPLCKLKSPHYLSKKALMRLGDKGCEFLWSNPEKFKEKIDEEFYDLIDNVRSSFTSSVWLNMSEEDRRNHIEQFLDGGAFQSSTTQASSR